MLSSSFLAGTKVELYDMTVCTVVTVAILLMSYSVLDLDLTMPNIELLSQY